METGRIPVATHAEVSSQGVIISFDDGKCALYPTTLLHATFSQATEVLESDLSDHEN